LFVFINLYTFILYNNRAHNWKSEDDIIQLIEKLIESDFHQSDHPFLNTDSPFYLYTGEELLLEVPPALYEN
jgi:hypothetical protein